MDEDRPAKRSASLAVIIALFGLAVVYVLSAGPAVTLRSHGYLSKGTFMSLYWPLAWLSRFTPFGRLLDWYVSLWP